MNTSRFFDSHMHTKHSQDGSVSVDKMCETAIKRGLVGIAITDHCDMYRGRRECLQVKDGLLRDVKRARETFDGLIISAGLELGEGHHNTDLAREVTEDPELDFVIGSLHQVRGEEDFYLIDYRRDDLPSLFAKYYDELEEMVECGFFDVVGHINYQARYMNVHEVCAANIAQYHGRLLPILDKIAASGKGIEVNTSGLRRKSVLDTLPGGRVLSAFHAAGGKIVTTGSDSHVTRQVGEGIEEGVARLKQAGFDEFAFFQKRRPQFYAI